MLLWFSALSNNSTTIYYIIYLSDIQSWSTTSHVLGYERPIRSTIRLVVRVARADRPFYCSLVTLYRQTQGIWYVDTWCVQLYTIYYIHITHTTGIRKYEVNKRLRFRSNMNFSFCYMAFFRLLDNFLKILKSFAKHVSAPYFPNERVTRPKTKVI